MVKHYTSGQDVVRVLDGVSLAVAGGEFVALYGPSGSGKTTLLTIIAGLLAPDRGTVTVGGHPISALDSSGAARYRRSRLGFVSQSLDLVGGGSAIDNASLRLLGYRPPGARRGLTLGEARRRVAPLLGRLGLSGRLDHRPSQLSGGERQRVLIARALSTEPELLLADEPTGNLDTRRSNDVLALMREICREKRVAVLLVTHDPHAAAFADRAVALSDGRLVPWVEQGASLTVDG